MAAIAPEASATGAEPPRRFTQSLPRFMSDRSLSRLVTCEVARNRRGIMVVLAEVPGSDGEAARLRSIEDALIACAGAPLFGDTVRRPTSERLAYDLTYERLRRALALEFVQQNKRMIAAVEPGALADTPDLPPVAAFAQCLARRNWVGARTLAIARPDTKEQRVAIAALQADFPACVAPNTRLDLDRQRLHEEIADAVYRRAAAGGAFATAG